MGLGIEVLNDWKEIRSVLPEFGHDFYVGSLADVMARDMSDKLASMRVDDVLVWQAFTHCYLTQSADIRRDVNSVIDEFGLGLRKTRARSKAVAGCVFVLVNRDGPSAIMLQRGDLKADDRKLSTEERLRRTSMTFEVVELADLNAQAEAHQASFWLTAYSGKDPDSCKKSIVAMQVEGEMAIQRFGRCLLHPTMDCQEATQDITLRHGLGARPSGVRSRPNPGCIALLLPGSGSGQAPGSAQAQQPRQPRQQPQQAAESDSESSSSSSSGSSDEECEVDLVRELEAVMQQSGVLLPLLPPSDDEDKGAAEAAPTPQAKRPVEETALALRSPDSTSSGSGRSHDPERRVKPRQAEQPASGGSIERMGKWASIPIECESLQDWTQICDILPDHGSDFWVSSFAGIGVRDLPDRLATMRIEESLAIDVFTHCYCTASDDVKADVNAVIEEFGLGLRRKQSRSDAVRGVAFVLVCDPGPSSLFKERAELPAHDRKLSSEMRIARTPLHFEVSDLASMVQQARRNQGSFYITSLSDANIQECKKKVITTTIDGKAVGDMFKRCLLIEAKDCHDTANQIFDRCGTGIRKSRAKCRPGPGCVALLLPAAPDPAAMAAARRPVVPKDATAPGDSSLQSPSSKRKREDGSRDAGGQEVLALEDAPKGKPLGKKEDLLKIQMLAIVKRLKVLLPTLPEQSLTTPFVQAKLEELFKKPPGRLNKFSKQIERILHAYKGRSMPSIQ